MKSANQIERELLLRRVGPLPSIGTLVGLAMMLGFGWLTVSSMLDWVAFPSSPAAATVKDAMAQPDKRGVWVTLTDAKVDCQAIRQLADSSERFAPATDATGSLHFIVKLDADSFCDVVQAHPQGVMGTISDRFLKNLRGSAAAGGQSLGWESYGPSGVLLLRPYHADSWIGVLVGLLLAGLGVLVAWFFGQTRTRRMIDEPAAASGPLLPKTTDELAKAPILPPGPFTVRKDWIIKTQFKAAALIVIGTAATAAIWGSAGTGVSSLVRERSIWRAGESTDEVEVAGATESNHGGIFNSMSGSVRFRDRKGQIHTGTFGFMTLLSSIDQQSPPSVRYDPLRPERFALSWSLDVETGRWAWIALLLGVLGWMGPLLAHAGIKIGRSLGRARETARSPQELEAAVTSRTMMKTHGRSTGTWMYTYRLPWEEKDRKGSYTRHAPGPLFLDETKTRILVVRSQENRDCVIPVAGDLTPFLFSEHERAQIKSKLIARGALS